MKTNLYIDDQLCSSFAELEQYFLELSSDSNAYHDLLDYSRHGDLIAWLKEQNEIELADRIRLIDQSLGDSEYMNQILAVFVSSENNITRFHKPEFSQCVNLSISNRNLTHNTLIVEISLEVLLAVNESYEVVVKTEWGIKGFTFNPSKYEDPKTSKISYTFHKRPGAEIERLLICVDGYILHDEPINKISGTNASRQLETIEDEQSPEERLTTTIQHIASTLIGVIQEAEIKRKEAANDTIQQPVCSHSNKDSSYLSKPAKKYSWQTPGYYAVIEKDRKEREEWEHRIRERQRQKEQDEQAEAERVSLEKWKRRHGIK